MFCLDSPLRNCCLRSLAVKHSLDDFNCGSFAWKLSPGIFRLIHSAWDLSLKSFRARSLWNFRCGTLAQGGVTYNMTFTFENRCPTQCSPRNTCIGSALDMSLRTLIASNKLWSSLSSTPCFSKRCLMCPDWLRRKCSSLLMAAFSTICRFLWRLLGQGIIETRWDKFQNPWLESK